MEEQSEIPQVLMCMFANVTAFLQPE